MRPPRSSFAAFGIAFFLLSPYVHAEPKALAALFQNAKPIRGKVKAKKLFPFPEEYRSYFHAKELLDSPGEIAKIESAQRELLLTRTRSQTKVLDKELDELFYALEIKRGSKLANKKSWKPSLDAYYRGLGGLSAFKWIYYWSAEDSQSLEKVCNRSKKKTDEMCLGLAKRVVDAFPKSAIETKLLRDLDPPETVVMGGSEGYGDRLSQTYTEKIEKDEEAFKPVLEQYLGNKDAELLKSAKAFLIEYPKSILRFRAIFLMAESINRTGNPAQANAYYQSLIDELPLSLYAIVSAQRIGLNLRDKIKKDPVSIDPDSINPNSVERITLERAQALFAKKNFDEVGIELDSLNRVRAYNNQFLLYLMRFAYDSNQNLTSFRFANELVQRKFNNFYQNEILNIIFPDRFEKEIAEQASIYHVDPLLVESLMKQESGFKAPILSSSGALGLMQLMPFTAIDTKKDLLLRTLKEPPVNIAVGTKYFASLLERYDGNVPYALAAYNAGPNRVAKWRKDNKPDLPMMDWIEAIPFKETRDYVMAILRNRYWYQYRKGVAPQNIFDAWKKQSAPVADKPQEKILDKPVPALVSPTPEVD